MAGRDVSEPMIRPGGSARCVAFSPDGSLLAIARSGAVELVDVEEGRTLRTLAGHDDELTAVAFSPDGTQLATASHDHTARIWDLTTGQTRTTLTGHTDWLRGVAFSPDGTQLATASDDHTARIWDLTTGQELISLIHLGEAAAAFHSDGSYSITGDPGDSVWWAIKLCRFAPGELDDYVPGLRPRPDQG